MHDWTSWWDLSFEAAQLGLEAQGVIGLRLLKLASGGPGAHVEAHRMVAEKAAALVDAQTGMAASFVSGNLHRAAGETIALYRQKVRANHQRLTRS